MGIYNNMNVNVSGPQQPSSTYKTLVLKGQVPFASQVTEPNTKYVIKHDFDLGGESVTIPTNCVLEFEGGSLSNGTLIGNNTPVIAPKTTIFDSITISGIWNVPMITSDWFKCINDNDIVQAFNLLSEDIQNTIIIEKRENDYWVDCQQGSTDYTTAVGILNLKSNTRCIINGTIRQRGHHSNYIFVIYLNNIENVILEGSGTIHGEKELHDYTGVTPILPPTEDYNKITHENNHVICIQKCNNVVVRGLSIMDSTGDGIDILNYHSNEENHIVVEDFFIHNCSRNGISAEGTFIEIKNGTIDTVNRTEPLAGIDIEISGKLPDREASNIIIENVNITRCWTGLQAYVNMRKNSDEDDTIIHADIHDLTFRNVNCSLINRAFYFADFIRDINIEGCSFDIIPSSETLSLSYSPTDNLSIERCRFSCDSDTCRKKWGWEDMPDEDGYVQENTEDKDFTLLRTRPSVSSLITVNRGFISNCIFHTPYTNFIKRCGYGTVFDECMITCFSLYVAVTHTDNIIRNSTIVVRGVDDRESNNTFFLDGAILENNIIKLNAPIRFYNLEMYNNSILFSTDVYRNSVQEKGNYKGYFIAKGYWSTLNLCGNIVTQRGAYLVSSIIDTSILGDGVHESSQLCLYSNVFTNLLTPFYTIPIEYRGDRGGSYVVSCGNILGKYLSDLYHANGPSENRPNYQNCYEGLVYFDSTLRRPIWNLGNGVWIRATGERADTPQIGDNSQIPTSGMSTPFRYFNTTTRKTVTWDGSRWINPDGSRVGVNFSGAWSERPTNPNNIYEGFMYMLNDGTNHFPIYAHLTGSSMGDIEWYKADGTQYTGS